MSKVGIITGGASGMGLAVAKSLSQKGWKLHLFDLNEATGTKAAKELQNATFHKVDVSSWDSISSAFEAAFKADGRLDFVYANAGVFENFRYYEETKTWPPPPPKELCIDINLNGVVKTSYLAMHYFRRSPHGGKDAVLIMTASCSGLVSLNLAILNLHWRADKGKYATDNTPLYGASKAGVVNFMYSIAHPLYKQSGIRTYCTCPGGVVTPLLSDAVWAMFPPEELTPITRIVSTVEMLIQGGAMTDSKGKEIEVGKDYGLAVEVNHEKYYFRDQIDFCDEMMAKIMKKTNTRD